MSKSHESAPSQVRKVKPIEVHNLEGGESKFRSGDILYVSTPEGEKKVTFSRYEEGAGDLIVLGSQGGECLLKKSGLLKSGDKFTLNGPDGKQEVTLVGFGEKPGETIVKDENGKPRILNRGHDAQKSFLAPDEE